jgi:hypothetical protein
MLLLSLMLRLGLMPRLSLMLLLSLMLWLGLMPRLSL